MPLLANKTILLRAVGLPVCCDLPRLAQFLRKEGATLLIDGEPEVADFLGARARDGLSSRTSRTGAAPDAVLAAPASLPFLHKLLEEREPSTAPPLVAAPFLTEQERTAQETSSFLHAASVQGITLLPPRGIEEATLPQSEILEGLVSSLQRRDLAGTSILVTAGPTIEDLDPVRFLSNRSTGKMGLALATVAARRGAEVHLIHGPLTLSIPSNSNITAVAVRSATEMAAAVMERASHVSAVVMSAAVADYTPVTVADQKLKKSQAGMTLQLKRTTDILASLGQLPERPILVGFAAETDNLQTRAMDKLERKNCDAICANNVALPGSGFGTDTNRVTIFLRSGDTIDLPLLTKTEVAKRILDIVKDLVQ